jgi:uncharacterized protein YggE
MSVRNLAVLVTILTSSAAAKSGEPTNRLVHVSGEGVVQVAPDRVIIDMNVSTVDDDLFRVRKNSDKDTQTIVDDAKKYGADEKCVRVSHTQLKLEYNEQLRRQIYNLDRDVAVELSDLTKLDHLLLDLLREPNVKVKNITFSASNPRQYESEAMKRAVADAREKAQHLAALNGLKLGKARDIRVQSEGQTPFVISVIPVVGSAHKHPAQRGTVRQESNAPDPFGAEGAPLPGKGFYFVAADVRDQKSERTEGKPFAPGLIDTTANVEIDFEMEE